ncbi:MAG: aminotransferase class V-fold PLP-dependent enzyme [Bryobacteraceae bacterium]
MKIKRRHLLAGGAAALAPAAGAQSVVEALPRKADFALREGQTYINCAYTHPLPAASAENVRRYVLSRSQPDGPAYERIDVKAEFAALINAKPPEVALVSSTSMGENLVVNGLGLAKGGGNVVTDALHFEGALIHLKELQKQGLDLRIVMPRDGRIELKDLERVVDRKTRLIELSHVAMLTGFQHDLKAVCDLAHANGALVYADVAQSAGCTPIDVKATGLDFCACSSFKWLMGDFGLGFLYAREDLLGRIVRRSQYGYFQAARMSTHFLPYDPPGKDPLAYELNANATGHFEVGTYAIGVQAALSKSLPYIRRLGVANIEAYRQPMLQRLHKEMPRLGFEPMTPPDSRSALISFAVKDAVPYAARLKKANVNVRLGRHFIRLSPSVFNDMADIERFLEAIS